MPQQTLREACQAFLADPSSSNRYRLLNAWLEAEWDDSDFTPEERKRLLQSFRDRYGDDDHQFDDNARFSDTDNGIWLQGWYWLTWKQAGVSPGYSDEDEEEASTPSWVGKHSVNCYICQALVDERECVPGPDGEGDICPNCQKEHHERD